MSTFTIPATTTPSGRRRTDLTDTRPGLSRLTRVELRKLVDTRAGMWLQIATALASLAIVAIVCIAGKSADHVFSRLLADALLPLSLLLPIAGILLVTSEWSQRTAQVTFALVPQRGRVMVAKLLAGIVLSLVGFLLCIVIAAAGTAITNPNLSNAWTLSPDLRLQMILYVVTAMVMGIGAGALLLSSSPAIVLRLVGPFVLAFAAISGIAFVETAGDWLGPIQSLLPLTRRPLSGTEWAQAGTTLAVWMLLPLLIGWWRIRRDEVK